MFNERAFLIRSLVAVFTVQIVIIGFDSFSCREKMKSNPTLSDYCSKVLDNYVDSNRSVANVFLALLVPASAPGVSRLLRGKKKANKPVESMESLKDPEG